MRKEKKKELINCKIILNKEKNKSNQVKMNDNLGFARKVK